MFPDSSWSPVESRLLVCGILSQDHDLEQMYLGHFLKIRLQTRRRGLTTLLRKLDKISEKFGDVCHQHF